MLYSVKIDTASALRCPECLCQLFWILPYTTSIFNKEDDVFRIKEKEGCNVDAASRREDSNVWNESERVEGRWIGWARGDGWLWLRLLIPDEVTEVSSADSILVGRQSTPPPAIRAAQRHVRYLLERELLALSHPFSSCFSLLLSFCFLPDPLVFFIFRSPQCLGKPLIRGPITFNIFDTLGTSDWGFFWSLMLVAPKALENSC